ncbi:TPA: class I SAM-dependent methyltransferase [Bacillus cereus]|uniref:class I SAM-dependent methyltransferase n=1 Tax=Bacillus TaxID=1386 RepID=UPI000863F7CC|nr:MULTISPECIES: class I SAM-dependent methyltransferase [Bacillus]MCP1177826.1 class I SAM-dependent methyltransferase [Bacillus sp. 1663tsa1]MCP1285672.1 class I SAM-dependent methyltransferase [Bacillus sp. S0635]MCQ6349911.1 class I SAM-dependent methyltransferase [Bacillus cereus]MCU5752343.1 class I SAM-dependent methyltransferase [Bacillus cereus]SCM90878.1 Uncharacterized protein BCF24048_00287 [Bacillus cereus]
MNNFKLGSDFDNLVSPLSAIELLNLFIQSCSQTKINGTLVPMFPPEEIQQQFVGASYEHALYEAYLFYSHVKTYAQNLGVPLNNERKILDFGCGWERIIRFFFKDVHDENLLGIDVDPLMITICNETLGNRAISDYESGNFVHSPTGAGDIRNSSFYGETVIPRTYIKNHYQKYLKLWDLFDNVNQLSQALFVLQKD